MKKFIFLILSCCLMSSASSTDSSLPAVFSDDMVLQRQMPVPVWGFADAGEEVDGFGRRELGRDHEVALVLTTVVVLVLLVEELLSDASSSCNLSLPT